jgi:hypothetical protein
MISRVIKMWPFQNSKRKSSCRSQNTSRYQTSGRCAHTTLCAGRSEPPHNPTLRLDPRTFKLSATLERILAASSAICAPPQSHLFTAIPLDRNATHGCPPIRKGECPVPTSFCIPTRACCPPPGEAAGGEDAHRRPPAIRRACNSLFSSTRSCHSPRTPRLCDCILVLAGVYIHFNLYATSILPTRCPPETAG